MNINKHSSISVSDIDVCIDRKEIKNLHIGVYPPDGRVRVATPLHIDDEAVRLAVVSRLAWIRRQIINFQAQPRQSKREMLSGESHYFLGKRYLLDVTYGATKHEVVLHHSKIELRVRANTSVENRQLLLNEWYRKRLKIEVKKLIAKYEKIMDVKVGNWEIKKMKTKWGSCTPTTKRILINLELVKKPIECIEYIVVHEMVHILERRHNDVFKSYLDKYLPSWERYRDVLNSECLGFDEWGSV